MDKESLRDGNDVIILEISAVARISGLSKHLGGYLILSHAIIRKGTFSLPALPD
jgi:hypothetical protein